MKLRYLSVLFLISLFVFEFYNQQGAHSYSLTPPARRTGAPGELTCNASGCHNSSSTVTNSPEITLKDVFANDSLASYTPGTQYNLVVSLSGAARYGFQLTALDASNNAAGTFALNANPTTTALTDSLGRQYMSHKSANSTAAWAFKWTAPATNVGPIKFYLAGNKANNSSDPTGDVIHLRSYTVPAAGGGGCSTFSAAISGDNAVCTGSSITLTASSQNGTGSNTYAWSGGSTSSQLTVTAAGTYTVTVTNGACSATASKTITAATTGVAGFTTSVSGNVVTITNTSTGSITSTGWTFGDGTSGTQTNASFTHTYTSPGTFTITLIVGDACGNETTETHDVTITSVGINSVEGNTGINVYPNPIQDQINVTVDGQAGNFNLVIYDITGKVVKTASGAAGSTIQLDRSGLDRGMYFYNVTVNGKNVTGKMLVN